jgi:uncharacterized protein YjgD (DUF1641 family)
MKTSFDMNLEKIQNEEKEEEIWESQFNQDDITQLLSESKKLTSSQHLEEMTQTSNDNNIPDEAMARIKSQELFNKQQK